MLDIDVCVLTNICDKMYKIKNHPLKGDSVEISVMTKKFQNLISHRNNGFFFKTFRPFWNCAVVGGVGGGGGEGLTKEYVGNAGLTLDQVRLV